MIKYSKLIPIVRAIESAGPEAQSLIAQRVLLPRPHDSADDADKKAREYLRALVAVPVEHWPAELSGVRVTAEILLTREED